MLLECPELLSTPTGALSNKWRMICTILEPAAAAAPGTVGAEFIPPSHPSSQEARAPPPPSSPTSQVTRAPPPLPPSPACGLRPELKAVLLTRSYTTLACLKYLLETSPPTPVGIASSQLPPVGEHVDTHEVPANGSDGAEVGYRSAVVEQSASSAGLADTVGTTTRRAAVAEEPATIRRAALVSEPGRLETLVEEVLLTSEAVFRTNHPGFSEWLKR